MIVRFLRFIWRLWFYILSITTILLLLPVLITSILSDRTYYIFFQLARFWAHIVYFGMGMRYSISRDFTPVKNKSYIIVSNHTSMLDITLMLIIFNKNPFVFVGKAELAKIPIFGFIYKRTCILVDRGDSKSRNEVFLEAKKRIDSGLSICIFPEGGVNDDESVILDNFKDGPFRMAIEHQLPILPLTFYGLKDFFPFVTSKGKPGKVLVKIHNEILPKSNDIHDKKNLKEESYQLILNQIQDFKKLKTV